jgi:hypothetical protein
MKGNIYIDLGLEDKDFDPSRSTTPMPEEKRLSSRSKEEILIDQV